MFSIPKCWASVYMGAVVCKRWNSDDADWGDSSLVVLALVSSTFTLLGVSIGLYKMCSPDLWKDKLYCKISKHFFEMDYSFAEDQNFKEFLLAGLDKGKEDSDEKDQNLKVVLSAGSDKGTEDSDEKVEDPDSDRTISVYKDIGNLYDVFDKELGKKTALREQLKLLSEFQSDRNEILKDFYLTFRENAKFLVYFKKNGNSENNVNNVKMVAPVEVSGKEEIDDDVKNVKNLAPVEISGKEEIDNVKVDSRKKVDNMLILLVASLHLSGLLSYMFVARKVDM